MSYRSLYLVCYDICNPKRLRRVRRFLNGYKVGGQKSFFECWLTPPELKAIREKLRELMDALEDRIHIFQLDPRMRTECYGQAESRPLDSPFFIL